MHISWGQFHLFSGAIGDLLHSVSANIEMKITHPLISAHTILELFHFLKLLKTQFRCSHLTDAFQGWRWFIQPRIQAETYHFNPIVYAPSGICYLYGVWAQISWTPAQLSCSAPLCVLFPRLTFQWLTRDRRFCVNLPTPLTPLPLPPPSAGAHKLLSKRRERGGFKCKWPNGCK